jgi:hypothetical protein
MINTGTIRMLCFLVTSFPTLTEKEDSASEKPVTQKGESLFATFLAFSPLNLLIGARINPVPK